MQKVDSSEIKYPGGMLHGLPTCIMLPLIREDGTRPTQVLFKSGDAEITVDTALKNVDELKVFLEQHSWAVGEINVLLRLEEKWADDRLLIGL
jgi:hypothetical protein